MNTLLLHLDLHLLVPQEHVRRDEPDLGPVPAGSLQQKALDCADANSEDFDRFLGSIEKTRTPKDASTKEEVDAHVSKVCGLALSEASIYLNGKGFLKVRRDRGQTSTSINMHSWTQMGRRRNRNSSKSQKRKLRPE